METTTETTSQRLERQGAEAKERWLGEMQALRSSLASMFIACDDDVKARKIMKAQHKCNEIFNLVSGS